jgi:type I restriction enzyme S subunit
MSVDVNSELPENWEKVKIGEFARTTSGGTPKRSNAEYYGGDVAWVKSGDLNDSALFSVGEYLTRLGLEKSSAKLFKPGTVLIALYGATIGRLSILQFEAATNQAVCGITVPKGVDNKYLFYYLLNIRKKLIKQGKGGAQPNISQGVVKDIEVPLAPPEQQKRIVAKIEELFSHIDAGIASLVKAKQLLKQYRQSVLKAAVTGELTKQWREDNKGKLEPASQLLERILQERRKKWEAQQLAQFKAKGKVPKDDGWKEKYKEPVVADVANLPEIPDEWEWATLPQLGELNRGKSKHRPRNAAILYGGEYPFVQTGDVRAANGWLTTYKKTYSEFGLKQSRLWPKGTLCITIAANIADTAVLGIDACFPDSVVGFIPHDEGIDVELIEFFIRTVKNDLEKYAPATAQKNINLAILETVGLPLLPSSEQKELVENVKNKLLIISRLDAEIDNKILRAEKNKQSILASAFSGGLVNHLDSDGSAKDLLANIEAGRLKVVAEKPTKKKPQKKREKLMKRLILDVLKEKGEISVSVLMQEAGYEEGEVESFYDALSDVSDSFVEIRPEGPKSKSWPYDDEVKLKLK